MKKSPLLLIPFLSFILFCSFPALAQDNLPPDQLHGKVLKEKEQNIDIIQGTPNRLFKKLAPIWSSKDNMDKTMDDLRKQAAKLDADAVIDIRTHTAEVKRDYAEPGFWDGPGYYGGVGPWGGYWGGVGYWGGYVAAHSTPQPVVQGWAVKWSGPPPSN